MGKPLKDMDLCELTEALVLARERYKDALIPDNVRDVMPEKERLMRNDMALSEYERARDEIFTEVRRQYPKPG